MKLEAIVQFFMVSIRLFATQPQSEDKVDNEFIRNTLVPILELVYRMYGDEKATPEVRDLSTELVDHLSSNLEKSYFVSTLNGVQ